MADPSIQNSPGIVSQPDSSPPPDRPARRCHSAARQLLIVFLVVFIDLLGFGIVLPLLPLIGDDYLKDLIPGGKDTAQGGAILGLLMSSFSFMQFIFAPIWGRVSDRVGRRPILLIGLVGSVVFYALFGYATDLPASAAGLALALLFAARIGQGIAGATIATAQAVIADCTTPDKRRHGMALIGAAFGIGFTFGPLVGAGALALFPDNKGVAGYAAACLSGIALFLGIRLLPETRHFGEEPTGRRNWLDLGAIREALGQPIIGPVVLTFFLATFGFGAFETTLAMMNRDLLGLPEKNNYLMFAYVGLVLMITQGLIYRRLAKRVTEPTFMAVGILFMGLGVAGIGAVNWMKANGTESGLLALMMIGMTFAVMGFAFLTPSAQSLVSRGTSADKQGEILGVNQSAAAMARILGPVFGLTLYKATPNHLLPYGFGAALLLAMLPLMPRIRRGTAQLAAAEMTVGH